MKEYNMIFQRMLITPKGEFPKEMTYGDTVEAKLVTFERFLEFVSENFRVTKSNIVLEFDLWCAQCDRPDSGFKSGLFKTLDTGIQPGELEMMKCIGKHMDEVPHTWKEEK